MHSPASARKRRLLSRKDAGSPRPNRSKIVEAARVDLLRNTGELVDRALKSQGRIDKFNAEDRPSARLKLVEEAHRRARKSGRFLTAAERFDIERLGSAGLPKDIGEPPIPIPEELPWIPPEFRKEFHWYDELQKRVAQIAQGSCTAEVDLDDVSPTTIRPGNLVTLSGTCFGDVPGAVLLRILPNPVPIDLTFPNIVELQISSWSSTRIEAFLPSDFGGFGPSDAGIWVRTLDGNHSAELPVTFAPRTWIWLAWWEKDVSGGAWGASKSGVLLSGRTLGNLSFSIEGTEAHTSGDGHGELQAPMAVGQSLAQGWHIGVEALDSARLNLLYRLSGPAEVDPPPVPELGSWGFLGES
jgi:hypothetical protein